MFKYCALATVSLVFSFSVIPAEASLLDYHRNVLENPTTQKIVTHRSRSAVSTRSRIAERLAFLRSKRLSNTTNVATTLIKADKAAFQMTVPTDFEKSADTLGTTEGELEITRRSGDRVTIRATDKVCSGGNAAYFDCFGRHWQSRQSEYLTNYSEPKVLRNVDLRWRNDVVGQQVGPDNTGRYYVIEQGSARHALFLFKTPDWENLWEVEINGAKTNSILADITGAQRILNTMFQEANTVDKNKDRLTVNRALNYGHRISTAAPRTRKSFYSKKDVVEISADGLDFSLEAPRSFAKIEDDIMISSGQMMIKDRSSKAKIKIWATEDQCNSQTSLIVRNCLRSFNNAQQKDFTKDKVNLSQVVQRNYGLQLSPAGDDRSDFALYTLYRSTEKAQRYGLLTWREPLEGHIWYAEIMAPEDNDSLLSNQQKLNALVTSLFYRP